MSEGTQVVPAVTACVRSPLVKRGDARRDQIAQNTSRNALWRTNPFLKIAQRRDKCRRFGCRDDAAQDGQLLLTATSKSSSAPCLNTRRAILRSGTSTRISSTAATTSGTAPRSISKLPVMLKPTSTTAARSNKIDGPSHVQGVDFVACI